MKKKILLFSLILISILFINIGKVSAEEYQVGDLVEVINPSGGESQKFLYIGELNSENSNYNGDDYFLVTAEPVVIDKSFSEFFDLYSGDNYLDVLNDDYEYLKFMNNIQFFSQELHYAVSTMIINNPNEDLIYSIIKKMNRGFYSYKNSCTNCDYQISYIETSDNPNELVQTLKFESRELLDSDNTKLNWYYIFTVSKNDVNIIRKVSSNNINTTNVIQTAKSVENTNNPKTSDINILLVGAGILLVGFGIILGLKKLQKLSK